MRQSGAADTHTHTQWGADGKPVRLLRGRPRRRNELPGGEVEGDESVEALPAASVSGATPTAWRRSGPLQRSLRLRRGVRVRRYEPLQRLFGSVLQGPSAGGSPPRFARRCGGELSSQGWSNSCLLRGITLPLLLPSGPSLPPLGFQLPSVLVAPFDFRNALRRSARHRTRGSRRKHFPCGNLHPPNHGVGSAQVDSDGSATALLARWRSP